MYHITLNIHIFGTVNGPDLAAQLQKTAPMERFEHQFSCFPQPTQESVSGGDILILADGADREMLSNLQSWRRERSVVVLCSDGALLSQLGEEELALVNRVWPQPLTPALLQFEFTALLRAMKARKDAWLTQAYLDTGINSIPMLVWFKDARGSHLKVNESFCGAVGKTMEQIENRGHYYIWDIPPEEYRQGEYICLESEVETMEKRCTCLFDENVKTKHGMRKFKTYKTPIFDEDGTTVLGTVGVASDVTDYLNMGSELDTLIDNIPMGVFICDNNWEILNVNRSIREFFPELAARLVGQNYQSFKGTTLLDIRPSSQPQFYDATIRHGSQTILVEFEETPLKDVFGTPIGYLCMYQNVTLARTYEAQIVHYANTDTLTGLSNRRHFFQKVAEKGLPDTVLFIDVDDFKGVNDRFGHQVGDLALQIVANSIQAVFPNAINSRSGGDEFIIALHDNCPQEELAAAVSALQDLVCSRSLCETPCKLSLSVGIARRNGQPITIDAMLRHGDTAMYDAKRQGKGRYAFYTPSEET